MGILSDKVALITGSSRGIGAAIARQFAQEGAKVVVHGRDLEALTSIQEEIKKSGGQVMQVAADITSFSEIEKMRLQIEKKFGPVDILVANAGGNPVKPGPLEEISEEGWNATLNSNLTATFLTIKSFLPGMKERKTGSILAISSAAARRPSSRTPIPYAAAKAGIQTLTQILSEQAGPYGIRVNCLAPETILTERNRRRIPDEQKQALVEMHPIKRLGLPEDVAQAALFLCSEEAAWITGTVLDIAGGSVLV